MGFDPLDSEDYHKFESTSGSGSNGSSDGQSGSSWGWQPILGWIIIILAVVGLICGIVANMPRY